VTDERPADWDEPVTLPAVDLSFERILVPFDGSHASEHALAWAKEFSGRTGAEVIVVVAYDPPFTVRRRGGITLESLRHEMESEAQSLAEEAVQLLVDRNVRARGIVVRGDVVDAILETAQDERADIIFLGRRGLSSEARAKGGRHELVHGSVADKIARHAQAPVVLVG
jgi:nucleotide-binding universal stress UspA family protein